MFPSPSFPDANILRDDGTTVVTAEEVPGAMLSPLSEFIGFSPEVPSRVEDPGQHLHCPPLSCLLSVVQPDGPQVFLIAGDSDVLERY